jgi:hypothetical protein
MTAQDVIDEMRKFLAQRRKEEHEFQARMNIEANKRYNGKLGWTSSPKEFYMTHGIYLWGSRGKEIAGYEMGGILTKLEEKIKQDE